MRTFSRKTVGVIVIGAILASCAGLWHHLQPSLGHAPTAAEAPISGLPASARHIRYFLPGSFPAGAYEFDVPEADFEAWVRAMPPPRLAPYPSMAIRCLDADGWPDATREIVDGIVYGWRHEDESKFAAYDRTNGRAYYYWAKR
jgi:hypothetical protein